MFLKGVVTGDTIGGGSLGRNKSNESIHYSPKLHPDGDYHHKPLNKMLNGHYSGKG